MESTSEQELRRQIEEFYLPRQLVDAILEIGRVPSVSVLRTVGIGFIDIADYSYLSRFLSPAENQALLNGLYTAFNSVLRSHGGYLNKIEGDSLMFHYGGPIDPSTRDLEDDAAAPEVARKLFRSCVEMQRVCSLFNRADVRFLENKASPQDMEMLDNAFKVMEQIRSTADVSPSLSAFFQIRIRIGAHIGQVIVGNFGPVGARQWDVIGEPVITAKRMEQTAPEGGLRISKELYEQLARCGEVDAYHADFRRKAAEIGSSFERVTREELFARRGVTVAEKRNAKFDSYSVQVHPDLPNKLAVQVGRLCETGEEGVSRALDIVRYHRGNRYVIDAIEETLSGMGVELRKAPMLRAILPKAYDRLVERGLSEEAIDAKVNARFSLFEILVRLGEYQDVLKDCETECVEVGTFNSYDQYLSQSRRVIEQRHKEERRKALQRAYFYNVIFPTVFESLRAGILEYYYLGHELEVVESA